jgi:hypothetical protein
MTFFLVLFTILAIFFLLKAQEWKGKAKDFESQMRASEQGAIDLAGRLQILENETSSSIELYRQTIETLANQFANDALKFIDTGVTASNLESSLKKIEKIFNLFAKLKISVEASQENEFRKRIQESFELEVKKDEARRAQQAIKEQIRDEQRAEAERERELRTLETREKDLSEALNEAMKRVKDVHSSEVEELQRQLNEAIEKKERAKSQAQLTKSGFVYVISNVGSFGEDVFKVGMTRRLEPMDRIGELSDASVPFPFDVHMMVSSDNAPELESIMHRSLDGDRVNLVNLRKEFFRTSLDKIASVVEKHHGRVSYRVSPEALEYNETVVIRERNVIEKKVA